MIVGGGDSAVDWANMLVGERTIGHARAPACDRSRHTRAPSHSFADRRPASCIESELAELSGDDRGVDVVHIRNVKTGESQIVPASIVIPALGHIASLGPLTEWGLSIKGRQIEVGTDMSTGRSMVYAAGDITDYAGKVRLMVVGFGEAATAVNNIAARLRPGEDIFPGHSSELTRPVAAGIGV